MDREGMISRNPVTGVAIPLHGQYANQIEIVRREHDAIVSFWFANGEDQPRTQVAGVVVPLSVLEGMEVHA